MIKPPLKLRNYAAEDEDAAIELWRRTWQQAYPRIDFTERVAWWRERWKNELVPQAKIVVAEMDGVLEGFVTVDQKTGYLPRNNPSNMHGAISNPSSQNSAASPKTPRPTRRWWPQSATADDGSPKTTPPPTPAAPT